jgi:hypothetical protein
MRSWLLILCAACTTTTEPAPQRPAEEATATQTSGSPEWAPELCDDQQDNDLDGATDCEDRDCDGQCPEICDDLRDNDGDGLFDCTDPDCDGECPERCFDDRDNDGDGATDCEDPDCDGGCPEVCDDARDNDGDGKVDCADTECSDTCEELCDDGVDNDADGQIDCNDDECAPQCQEDCSNGADDDGDALADCADPDCTATCDADGDGWHAVARGGQDCDDDDALVNPGLFEICGDGRDNDCSEGDPPCTPDSGAIWYAPEPFPDDSGHDTAEGHLELDSADYDRVPVWDSGGI